MPQESPTSLGEQLSPYTHPHEESQQLAPTRPSEPCPALCGPAWQRGTDPRLARAGLAWVES